MVTGAGQFGERSDTVVHEREPYNAEPTPHALSGSVVTPIDAFYSRNHGPIPQLDPQAWRLRVTGLVDRELELSLADLQDRYAHRTLTATLQCAGNRRSGLLAFRDIPGEDPWGPGATSTAQWTGVALSDVLAAAGTHAPAGHVAFSAPDVSTLADPPQPYGSSIPLSKARSGEVLLAWAMNGQPLPAVHGGPVRVVVPGYIGARSVKWLTDLTVQAEPSDNYFQATAYRLLPADADLAAAAAPNGLPLGQVALNSAILRPNDGDTLASGPVEVAGYALVGDDRTVARVDVSADDGSTWVQAHLDEQPSPWTWQLWHTTLPLPPGRHHLVVRAWDSTGTPQPALPEHVWNPKGYVNTSWHHITVTVGS